MPNLIDPRYCCLGIYGILVEQTAVAIACGVLSFTAPSVVGAASPTFVTYIFGIVCFVGVAIQPIGFFGVFREKTTTYRLYTALNAIATAAALIVGAVIVIISAVRHNKAMTNCKTNYFTAPTGTTQAAQTTLDQEADILCMAFAWVDIGFMGGLWVLLFITQTYFVFITRGYGKVQVEDHKLYHSVYSENPEAFTMSILQSRRYNPDSVMFTNSMYGGSHHRPSHDARKSHDVRPSHDFSRYGAEPGPENGGGYYNHQGGYADPHEGQFDDYDAQQHGMAPHDQYAFNSPGGGYVDSAHPHGKDGGQHVHYAAEPSNAR